MDDLERVIVVGGSCSGKTTLSHRISEKLDMPRIELDALHWGPNWQENPRDEFRESVSQAIAQPRWVLDGNYTFVREITWPRATTIIWLNYSFPLVYQRTIRRTLSRVFRRTKLYSDNQERFFRTFFSRESMLWWVLTSHHWRRKEIDQLLQEPENAHLQIVVCKKPADAEAFLTKIETKH